MGKRDVSTELKELIDKAKKKGDYNNAKWAVKQGRQIANKKKHLEIGIYNLRQLNEALSAINEMRVKGDVYRATDILLGAYRDFEESYSEGEFKGGYRHDQDFDKDKIENAFLIRAQRLGKAISKEKEPNVNYLSDLLNLSEKIEGNSPGTSPLEKTAATASIILIFAGLIFSVPNMTGNAIADIPSKTSSFISIGLLIAGLFAGAFWLNRK